MYNIKELGSDLMEHEHKWFSFSKVAATVGLLIILLIVILIEIVLFISGPVLRYTDKVDKQIKTIQTSYEQVEEINRHVFNYIIYSAHDDQSYYWFNENGELLTSRAMAEVRLDEVKQLAVSDYQLEDATVKIGYGYENPVYIIENEQMEVYLDFDSMKQVFIRKKGGNV